MKVRSPILVGVSQCFCSLLHGKWYSLTMRQLVDALFHLYQQSTAILAALPHQDARWSQVSEAGKLQHIAIDSFSLLAIPWCCLKMSLERRGKGVGFFIYGHGMPQWEIQWHHQIWNNLFRWIMKMVHRFSWDMQGFMNFMTFDTINIGGMELIPNGSHWIQNGS